MTEKSDFYVRFNANCIPEKVVEMRTLKHWLSHVYRRIRLYWSIRHAFIYDFRRYFRFSTPESGGFPEQQAARLMAVAHGLEKGLAMTSPRPGFGIIKAEFLLKSLREYEKSFPDRLDHFGYRLAGGILGHYVEFQKKCGTVLPEDLAEYTVAGEARGGTKILKGSELLEAARGNFRELAGSRTSIRDYSGEPVSMETIREAVSLACRTPSSCNRQPGRVYLIADPGRIRKVCEMLPGYHAFGNPPDKLLLAASDTRVFARAGESHQAWVEGGMFAMSLIYALNYLGVASCILNWSVPPEMDLEMRRILDIDEAHQDLFFIALGHFKEENKAAASERRPVEEILFIR